MRFSIITIFNFKAFIGEHTIDLVGGEGGLRFLCSENKADPDLEANGCGKSTLWDALFWVLYGRTLRGVKAVNVRSWGETGPASVTLPFEIDGDEYILYRSWGPNKLQLIKNDGEYKSIEQEDIDILIGLNAESFTNSIIMGQFNKMFFDMKPAEKMAMFTDVLDLEDWEKRSKTASTLAKGFGEKLRGAEHLRNTTLSRIETLEEQIEGLEYSSREFEKKAKTRLKEANDKKSSIEAKGKKKRAAAEKTKKEHNVATKDLDEINEKHDNENTEYKKLTQEINRLEKDLTDNTARSETLEDRLEEIKNAKDTCPVCKQKIKTNKKHIQDEKNKLTAKLDVLSEEADELKIEIKDYEETIEDINDSFEKIEDLHNKAEKTVRELERLIREEDNTLSNLRRDLKEVNRAIDEAGNVKNPYESQLDDLDDKINDTEDTLTEAEQSIKDLTTEVEAHEFWVKGFKEIRLMLIDEALVALEVEVNNNLIQLGLAGWEVGFEVERETQAGGVSKGFTVYILSPRNDDLVPWECWSGGETQRLALAGTMGLCNLILNQRGIDTNLEVYDEPTAHISEKGVGQLADLLQQRAVDTGKQLWLVDHRTVEYGGFESIVKIIKDKDGARIAS